MVYNDIDAYFLRRIRVVISGLLSGGSDIIFFIVEHLGASEEGRAPSSI
jgi:hypothetical protein